MTTISSTNRASENTNDHKVVCEVCHISLILKTEDEKNRTWWHNCIDDLFYGMPKLELIRFSGENREKENHGHSD